jgi:hypothetical protein
MVILNDLCRFYSGVWRTPPYTRIYIPVVCGREPVWILAGISTIRVDVNRTSMKRFISLQFLNLSWENSLNGGSARRKATTYTGQHGHRINADKYPCLEFKRAKTFHALDGAAAVIGNHICKHTHNPNSQTTVIILTKSMYRCLHISKLLPWLKFPEDEVD